MKVKKSYRLDEKTVSELEKCSQFLGLNQTATLEHVIRSFYETTLSSGDNSQSKDTQAPPMVEALINQLDKKDEQIATLQRLLDQAQKLHLATQADIALLETTSARRHKRPWWRRIQKRPKPES